MSPVVERRAGGAAGARMAITGVGAVSGFGRGVEALRRGLDSGASAIRPITRFDVSGYRTRLAAEAPDRSATAGTDRLSLADRFALEAAGEAIAHAGLPPSFEAVPELRVGIYFGSSTGGMLESEEYFARLLAAPRRAARIAPLSAQPTSAPADSVARAHGVTGPVMTIASACASATLAFGSALQALRDGDVDVALVGGSDCLCRLTYAGFNSLRAVDARACRPFRAEREGMSIGEGAAVLVLEPEERARARGAKILSYLRGAGAACDAYHMTAPDPEGAGIRRAVEAALADAGLDADAIDLVNAHGTGTPHNDAAEAKMLAAIFAGRAATLPLASTKGSLGHFLGSAGAIEAIATLLALAEGRVHATPGEGTTDPALGVDLVTGEARPVPGARFALSTNLAFGGANAAIVLEAP
jgi:3-oxoacyl-[acyl-carrier-protein] synthase II